MVTLYPAWVVVLVVVRECQDRDMRPKIGMAAHAHTSVPNFLHPRDSIAWLDFISEKEQEELAAQIKEFVDAFLRPVDQFSLMHALL